MAVGLPEIRPGEALLPERMHVTPSQPNPWRDARQPSQRYTGMQLSVLHRTGIDADTVADVIVRQSVTHREYYIPPGQKPLVYVMPCPIVGDRQKNGQRQLLVISPDGSRKYVREDGQILGGKKWS